jgi:hypothetical protein
MFTPKQFRLKAAEYAELGKMANNPNETREFQNLERSFTTLADNEQWLADNHHRVLHASDCQDASESVSAEKSDTVLAEEEERVLRCLGASLIMLWNTLPRKLQRELFDNAGAMGELFDTASLRGQIARFLHKHKDGDEPVPASEPSASLVGQQ